MLGISKRISRRNALRWLASGAAVSAVLPVAATASGCNAEPDVLPDNNGNSVDIPDDLGTYPYQLPELPYGYDAVDEAIDAETMEIHHSRHHQAYVDSLNNALEQESELQDLRLEEILADLNRVPDGIREQVRNHGGGHLNHAMFWDMIGPDGGGQPDGEVAQAINDAFGSFEDFQSEFEQAAGGVFGSGWAWLVSNENGEVSIMQTPNQDSPIMEGYRPLLGVDVWEHAYYIRYRNQRGEYVGNFWEVVDWESVNTRYTI